MIDNPMLTTTYTLLGSALFCVGIYFLIPKGNKWRILPGALATIYVGMWMVVNLWLLVALAVMLFSASGIVYVSLRLAANYGVSWAQNAVNWAHRNLTPKALTHRRKGLNEYGLIPLTEEERIRARNSAGVKPLDE